MPTPLAEMPFHARLSGSTLSESPLGKIIFEHEAQVVADHEAGRITDAEFDAFYQKASENLDRLADLNAHSVEASQEFKETVTTLEKDVETADGSAAEVFRASEEARKVGLEGAAEKNLVQSELLHGWVDAARDLIELRGRFENADAAALDRDRTVVAEREQEFDATDRTYDSRIAVEMEKVDRHLSDADRLAEFEQREDEVRERVSDAKQELATFDRRIEEAKADAVSIDPHDPDGPQRLAESDQRVADLQTERYVYARTSHEALDPDLLQQLEASKDYVTTLAQPGLESTDAAQRIATRQALNNELAESEQRLAEHRADMAARSSNYAERDAVVEQIEANKTRIEELERITERENNWAAANRERFDEYQNSNSELKQEIDSVNSELAHQLHVQAAEDERRTADVAGRLEARLADDTSDSGTESATRDQAGLDREAGIERLEATLTDLQEQLLGQINAQVREQEAITSEHDVERQADAGRAADVQAGADAGSAQRSSGGAGGDAGGFNEASDQAVVRYAEVVDATVTDGTVIDATVIDATVIDATVIDATVIDAEVYIDGALDDEVVYADLVDLSVDVHFADSSVGDDALDDATGQSGVIEAALYGDAKHSEVADPDVAMRSADRSTGDETDSSASS